MKKIFFCVLIAALSCILPASGRTNPGEKVGVEFSELVHDFGNVDEDGGPVTCKFKVTNNSSYPVAIVSAVASCGCTRPEFNKRPIAPGKSAEIKVSYLPKAQKGEFDKEVKVSLKSASDKSERVKLRIRGVVIPETK